MAKLPQLMIGWREWVALPGLAIPHIKAKIDTGARTSALHAFSLEPFRRHGKEQIRFYVHPLQRDNHKTIECTANVVDLRWVSDSGGHREHRYVIETTLMIGNDSWPIELTLTNRDTMRFRMLIGRTAFQHGYLINPLASYLSGNKKGRKS